jgi:ABC-type dipeptide/oligopeptide/nickel transport system permease subunit
VSAVPTTVAPRRGPFGRLAGTRRIGGNRVAYVGAGLVGFVVLMAVVSLFWTPYPSDEMNLLDKFQGPSWHHIAGTDEFGRDLFSRIMVGSQASLLISGLAVLIALVVGGTLAIICGYVGGIVDILVMRLADLLLAIPALLVAIGVVAVLGPSGESVSIALASAYAPAFARVIQSAVVAARHQPYVEASSGLGARMPALLRKDILPNILPIIIVQVTTSLAWGILDEANLGFLGLGVQPPNPSWGSLLIEGRTYFFDASWMPIGAGIAVVVAVFGFNMLGDGLRDVLDPRAWRRD